MIPVPIFQRQIGVEEDVGMEQLLVESNKGFYLGGAMPIITNWLKE